MLGPWSLGTSILVVIYPQLPIPSALLYTSPPGKIPQRRKEMFRRKQFQVLLTHVDNHLPENSSVFHHRGYTHV